jgi:hypothetical protein
MSENEYSGSSKHPVAIQVGPNPDMGCFDVHLMAGNFATEEAAAEYARIIAEFLEREADGEISSIQ